MIYLDYNASTPVDPAAREAMWPYLGEYYGNPSSGHVKGKEVSTAVAEARDSSGRGTAHAELAAMQVRPSHHLPGQEIPESSWAYRFAKKNYFFGFGAYG